jgi:hypothetical protein
MGPDAIVVVGIGAEDSAKMRFAPKSCSEMALLGVDFARKCARKPGPSCEPLTVEKRLAASLAESIGFEPAVAL